MIHRAFPVFLAAIFAGSSVWANVAGLALTSAKATGGDPQFLEVEFKAPGTYDVYLVLSGPKGWFHFLRPDGSFATGRRARPFLKGLHVKKPGKIQLHGWRVTGLKKGTYRWSVVLTPPGKSITGKANRVGLATSAFSVSPFSGKTVYRELAEGGGRGKTDSRTATARGRSGALRMGGGVTLDATKPRHDGAVLEAVEVDETAMKTAPPREDESDIAMPKAGGKFGYAGKKPADAARYNSARPARALSAGASDDNKDFAHFLKFLQERNSPTVMAMDVSQRIFITVLDAEGRHVPNADVEVRSGNEVLYSGRTYANGQTLFFASAVPELEGEQTLDVLVRKGAIEAAYRYTVTLSRDEKLANQFDPKQLPKPAPIEDHIHPHLPICREAAGHKDRKAILQAARRAAAEAGAQQQAINNLDWLEDSGEADAIVEEEKPVERKRAGEEKGDWVLRLPVPVDAVQPRVDLVFQIDTTGSMHDEIRSIQKTLDTVADRIDKMTPRPLVRWGLVLYGDKTDRYTTRTYPFTSDVAEFRKWINSAELTGGGDTPEAALEGLHESVSKMAWDSGDAIRLIFLVADAPPHLDYGRPYTYLDKMREAIGKGIKIYPTAASGLDKQGEYIFRQWAQASMAKFLFITYGAGTKAGGPAGKTPHEVKQPKKRNDLDDIIVKTVGEEVKNWTEPTFYSHGATQKGDLQVEELPEGLF